jgi:hypothetical protein
MDHKNKKITKMFSVPVFAATQKVVLFNIKTLDCFEVSLGSEV